MITNYYCKRCNEFFEEKSVPNINKTHICGAIAKIVRHASIEEREE